MYIKNRSGPRMEPCGTPHNTGRLGDVCESKINELCSICQIAFNPFVSYATYSICIQFAQ